MHHLDGIWHDVEFTLDDIYNMISVNGVLETVFVDPQSVTLGDIWLAVVDGGSYFDDVLV